jgi:hypothetical protein
LRQNWSSLAMLLPHCLQNVLMDSSKAIVPGASNLQETYSSQWAASMR